MSTKMTVEEFRTIVKGLRTAYPKDNFIASEYTFDLWYKALMDIDYITLNKASIAYIMSNRYPPAISDLRQLAYDLISPADEIAAEEWARLMKALGQSGSTEAYNRWQRLPEITREIVGGFSEFKEWGHVPISELISVQRPMFIKRFEEKTRQRRLSGPLPGQFQPPRKSLETYTPPAIPAKEGPPPEKMPAPADMLAKLRSRLGA